MIFSIKNIMLGLLILLVAFIIIDSIRFYLLFRKGTKLASDAVPYERIMSDAKMKILVLGDSTAVGTGTANNIGSTAGRLASVYPDASITNRAVNGLKLEGLLKLLAKSDENEHFDIILVQIGANDVIRMTAMDYIEKRAQLVIEKLKKKTDRLIILHSGNIGDALIWPVYMRPIIKSRSYEIREVYKKLASDLGVHYVDLIDAPSDKLLRDFPTTYYSADFLHLNEAGYGLWFDEIKKAL